MCCPCRDASILGSEATVVGCDTYGIPIGSLKECDVMAVGHDAKGESYPTSMFIFQDQTNRMTCRPKLRTEEALLITVGEGWMCRSNEHVLVKGRAVQCRSFRNGTRLEPSTAGTRIQKDSYPMR